MGLLHDDPNSDDDASAPILVRMDSMEIEAHAKAMTRIEILYMTNVVILRYLLKKEFSNIIPKELFHYLDDGDHNRVMYYRVTEAKKPAYKTAESPKLYGKWCCCRKFFWRTSHRNAFPTYQNTRCFNASLRSRQCPKPV